MEPTFNMSASSNANQTREGIELAVELVLPSTEPPENSPPIPFVLCRHEVEDGPTSKKNASAEQVLAMLGSADNNGPHAPVSFGFEDGPSREKLTGTELSKLRSDLSNITLSVADTDYLNRNEACPNQEVVQTRTVVNANYGLYSPTPMIQDTSNLQWDLNHVQSHSVPIDNAQEEDTNEDVFFIPEAFLVDENAPLDVPDVGVAELVEPDQTTVSLKKIIFV
jgi:hypothetical protein